MTLNPERRGMTVRSGIHEHLEAQANEILRQALAPITKHSAKSDVLTPWKEQDRRSREIYVSTGTPDASLRRGNFNRAYNSHPTHSHLNSVEGMRPPRESQRSQPEGHFDPNTLNGNSGIYWDQI